MVQLGAHAFVWLAEWNREQGDYAIEQVASMGFDFIEIPLLDPAGFDADHHRAVLEGHDIKAAFSLALPADAHMPTEPQKAVRFFKTALEKVQQTGSDYLCGCTGYSLGLLTGEPPTEAEIENVVAGLREVAEEAGKLGVTLGIEVCNRYETSVFNTLADTQSAIRKTGTDNLRLHADTYHMNIEEEGFYQPIKATQDVLDYVHMSESHRGLVGTGTVDWDAIWTALAEIGFSGRLVL